MVGSGPFVVQPNFWLMPLTLVGSIQL